MCLSTFLRSINRKWFRFLFFSLLLSHCCTFLWLRGLITSIQNQFICEIYFFFVALKYPQFLVDFLFATILCGKAAISIVPIVISILNIWFWIQWNGNKIQAENNLFRDSDRIIKRYRLSDFATLQIWWERDFALKAHIWMNIYTYMFYIFNVLFVSKACVLYFAVCFFFFFLLCLPKCHWNWQSDTKHLNLIEVTGTIGFFVCSGI